MYIFIVLLFLEMMLYGCFQWWYSIFLTTDSIKLQTLEQWWDSAGSHRFARTGSWNYWCSLLFVHCCFVALVFEHCNYSCSSPHLPQSLWSHSHRLHDARHDRVCHFQIGAGLYAVGRPVQKKERRGRPNRHQSIPAPRERGLIQPFFRYAGPWTPSCGWRGFWPYRGMSRRIPDRQPRLGLATCVRQK